MESSDEESDFEQTSSEEEFRPLKRPHVQRQPPPRRYKSLTQLTSTTGSMPTMRNQGRRAAARDSDYGTETTSSDSDEELEEERSPSPVLSSPRLKCEGCKRGLWASNVPSGAFFHE